MKKFIAVHVVAAALFVLAACSASQKKAETTLATDTTECVAKCGVTKALTTTEKPEEIAADCGVQCSVDLLTNPDERNALLTIISGTRNAQAAARRPDAGQ